MPWESVSLSGGVAVSILISILKRFGLSASAAQPVTWVAGFLWLVVTGVGADKTWVEAVLNAAILVVSAPGFYELIGKPVRQTMASSR